MLDLFTGTPTFLPWHVALVVLAATLAMLVLLRPARD